MTVENRDSALRVMLPSDLEIALTRAFDAPRRLVFEACTRPEHVRRWWGPLGSTLTVCEIDLRPGGTWRYVVCTPDGNEHPFKGVYREIVPPERVVQTFIYDVEGIRDHEALETLTLDEQAGKTTLRVTVLHKTKAARDGHLQSGMEAGASQTYDRLAELLRAMASPVRELVLTRTFDAPRSVVFKAWIDPQQLARWWCPRGFTNPVCEVDARPGGAIRIDMHGPDGTVYPMTGVFHEIVAPERLVFACSAHADEAGNPGLEVVNTVTFAEQNGKTTLTVHAVVVKAVLPLAAAALAGMDEGWTQTLERLEAEVANARG
jgi:uncharacterized protein YndB with AHSA1/START domain